MKYFKPLIFALTTATLDFFYRVLRHLKVDIWFFAISFMVFLTIFFVVFNNQKE
ncbi:MAG: hypothetical protein WA052_02860 [Microgenomates group bacterium]